MTDKIIELHCNTEYCHYVEAYIGAEAIAYDDEYPLRVISCDSEIAFLKTILDLIRLENGNGTDLDDIEWNIDRRIKQLKGDQ